MKRQLPKNVRQIGNVSDSSKIYVEDYVDTFLNQLCEKAEQETAGAFLIGEIVREEDQDFIYIYGAIHMKELEKKGKDFAIGENIWKHACETCKEFFGDAEILGWVLAGEDIPKEATHNIQKIHQKYFPREQSVFVTKNARDKEENFYIYKYRHMMECAGHYVYYEKNMEMQNYMIASRKKVGLTPSEIIEDRVAKSFRSIIQEKEKKNEQKSHSKITYALSTFLILVAVVIGVSMINNYQKMRRVKDSLEQVKEDTFKEEEEEVIEVIGDNIENVIPKDEEKEEEQEEQQEEQKEEQQEQEVVVAPEPTEEAYIVQKGDTLESICIKKYGNNSRIKEICQVNGLQDGNLIFVGQKLLLP